MRLHKFLLAATVIAAFTMSAIPSSADIVLFDFLDEVDPVDGVDADITSDLDGGNNDGSGTIGSSTTIDGLTLELVDIFAPQFADVDMDPATPLELTGTILFASNGENVTTNIAGNRDRIAVNNPSINNTGFDLIDGGAESSDFNTGEGFIFNLSGNAAIDVIEFENLNPDNIYTVSIDGGASQAFNDPEGNVTGTGLGALEGVEIAAGTSITIEVSGPLVGNRGGIESITFHTIAAEVVPEPSSLALLGLFGSVAMIRRRR